MLWANGRGATDEVVAVPGSDLWDWRLSIAEVNEDGPFSILPGVARALVVASGKGMILNVDGMDHTVRTFEEVRFSGDVATDGKLLEGPVRDLNLMVRRLAGLGLPELRVVRSEAGSDVSLGDAVAAVVLDGWVMIEGGPEVLAERFDVFLPEPTDAVGSGVLTAFTDSVIVLACLRSAS